MLWRRFGSGAVWYLGELVLAPSLQLNPVYLPELCATLGMPQSVGVVGGRPASSLYFVGFQGESVLFLDPHQVQAAACDDVDWATFRCDVLRTMALPAIDPSLALGFYCGGAGEWLPRSNAGEMSAAR